MAAFRSVLSCAIVAGSLTLAGCEQGNDPGGPPAIIPPDAPKTPEESVNIGKNAPDPTKKPKPPLPPASLK